MSQNQSLMCSLAISDSILFLVNSVVDTNSFVDYNAGLYLINLDMMSKYTGYTMCCLLYLYSIVMTNIL